MIATIILSFSIIFQALAAFYSLRFIKKTLHAASWVLISIALILMIFRRSINLFNLLFEPLVFHIDLLYELLGLILSIILFLGIKNIGDTFIQRKATEDERNRKQSDFKLILNSAPIIIFYKDRMGRFLRINKTFADQLNMSEEEFLGKTVFDLYSADIAQGMTNDDNQVIESGRPKLGIIEQYESKQGKRWVQTDKIPIFDDENKVIGLIGFAQDITKRKKTEEELSKYREGLEKLIHERTKELQRTYKEIEDTKRLSDIGLLAATIAHELRNPLGVIKIAIYNIERKKKDSSFDSHLANIDKKISESDQIIRNLLSYSKIKMPHYQSVDIYKVLRDCIKQSKDKYAKWDVKVKVILPSDEKNIIDADRVQMSELFLNILDNAYQSFPDKTGFIQISLSTDKNKNQLNIEFNDNGIGVNQNDLKKVFDPFFTNRAKGIGLGLTVCQQIVNIHNGLINIQSQKEKGTTVYIQLPMKKYE